MKNICIYHKNCADGFASALAVNLHVEDCEFIPAHYGDTPPDVSGKNVYIVDFSYDRDTLLSMNDSALSLVVIDHHKTAQAALEGLEFCIFNMDKCGAVLTWEYFSDEPLPELFRYVQDRDLWNWDLPESKEVSAALKAKPFDFDIWNKYLLNCAPLVADGKAILSYQNSIVEKIANAGLPLEMISGHLVPCINCTNLISEIGNEISKGYPFAAMWFETEGKRVYSLRSQDDGVDVSEIAKGFGGGGHYRAAGFSVQALGVNLM